MVNIWTYGYYVEQKHRVELPLIENEFKNIPTKWFKENTKIIKVIIGEIEGTTIIDNGIYFISKFTGEMIPLQALSTGCKTALVSCYKAQTPRAAFINLTETGPRALRVCLQLLDKAPHLLGVMVTPNKLNGSYQAFELTVNNQPAKSWIRVIALCTEEMN